MDIILLYLFALKVILKMTISVLNWHVFFRSGASNIGWDTVIQITRLTDQIFQEFRDDLKAQGWDLQRCHLGPDEWRFEWEDKTL